MFNTPYRPQNAIIRYLYKLRGTVEIKHCPVYENLYKKKFVKEKRRLATAERQITQKEYHILTKQIEKIEVKLEEECKQIQEELLNKYENMFTEK